MDKLTRQEKNILAGKVKRPSTAFNLFIQDYFATHKSSSLQSANIAYKQLPEFEKEEYARRSEAVRHTENV